MALGKKLDYGVCENNFFKWLVDIEKFDEVGMSESDTRSKLIDSLFLEVLGWDEEQIVREEYVKSTGFYDYLFQSGQNKFILEAKKMEVDFILPKARTVKFKSLNDKKCSIQDAINQGINYAAVKGADTVVVFNGKQMAVTYIPFINLVHHDTYLFWDLKDLKDNFIRFFNVLSPLSSSIKNLPEIIVPNDSEALIRQRPYFSDRITNQQPDKNGKAYENLLAKYFEQIHGKYFSDIISDEDLLQKCYVESEASEKLEREIETVLRDRAHLIDYPISEIETTKKSAGKFGDVFVSNKNGTKLFLLLGGSGVGKTTFIFRFFNFILTKLEKDYLVWLYLDFKKMSETGNIDEFVYKQIEEQLAEKYEHLELYSNPLKMKAIFAKDLKREQGTINMYTTDEEKNREIIEVIKRSKQDKAHHVQRIFEYLKHNGYGTCVIYDNVDQLNTELQKKIFLQSNVIRENLKTTVICSLREEVYYNHKDDSIFNFSEIERFHIPSPRLKNVISKRIKKIKDDTPSQEKFSTESNDGKHVYINKLDIIDVLTQTFLGRPENLQLIEMLANNDLRDSLKYFKSIISSYNIDFDTILVSAGMYAAGSKASETKVIDSSEILRALALQDRVHFRGEKSEPLINIFSIESDGFFSHFIKIRILMYAQTRINISMGTTPTGYFIIRQMYEEKFKNYVNSIDNFIGICKSLQKIGALININGTLTELDGEDMVRLGASGKYYIDTLIFNPYYLALIAIDTPLSTEAFDRIADIYKKSQFVEGSKKIKYVQMAKEFVKYLVAEEEKERKFLESLDDSISYSDEYFLISKKIEESVKKFIIE